MLTATTKHHKQNQQPPPPIITATGARTYEVYSRRSGNTYEANVGDDGLVVCGCKARAACYHMPFVERAHARRQRWVKNPVGFVRDQLRLIGRLAQGEPPDFETMEDIGRAAGAALQALDEHERALAALAQGRAA